MSYDVLVVADEQDVTAPAAYHLADAGHRATTAGDGSEALTASDRPPGLVVLDPMLSDPPGFEVFVS